MVKLILEEASTKKIQQVSLSDDTIKRPISFMATDVKQLVIAETKLSPMFSIQVDESTNVASRSQFLVFVRYIHIKEVKEEILQGHGNFSHFSRCNGQHLKFFYSRRLAVGKALWCVYGWSPRDAGMQIWCPNENQRKIS